MGTWGAGLFSDDTALDLKGDWEELYKRFGEPDGTTRELLTIYDADDEDDGPVVILALAMCQWKYGCLQPDIKARALKVIRTGAGLHMWEDAKDLARRKGVYTQLADALERPLPPRKRIKQLIPLEVTPYKPGQLLKYRCWDGECILLWVRGQYRYKGDVLPLCAALDWKGFELPSSRDIAALSPVINSVDAFNREYFGAEAGLKSAPQPGAHEWTKYAPREMSRYGFESSRVEIVPGNWHWDLVERRSGPQVPRWIEVGPMIARALSAAEACRKTLPRFVDLWNKPKVLPKHPRPLAPRSAPPRPLEIDIPLPKGRATKKSDLLTLKRTNHQPRPGDIFVVNVKGKRWVVGRVILADAHFACGPADILVYFYRQRFETTAQITLPMSLHDLAIVPRAAHDLNWEWGEFLHIANVPLDPFELPARHVFGPSPRGYYLDAYGIPTPSPTDDELVGKMGIGGIGWELTDSLGVR